MARTSAITAEGVEDAVGGVDAVKILSDLAAEKALRDGLRGIAFNFDRTAFVVHRDQDCAGVGAVVGADGVDDAEGGGGRGHETILSRARIGGGQR